MELTKRKLLLLAGIIGLVVLRFALIINPLIEPDRAITVDSEQYLSLADNIVNDFSYASPLSDELDLFRAPGYPAFLAGILWISSGSLSAILFIQYIFGLICGYLLYLIGKETASEGIGIVASLLFLLSPNALFWSATIMTEILFTLGLSLSLFLTWRVVRDQFPLWPIGLLLGGMSLIRPIGLYLMLIWGVWILLSTRQNREWAPGYRKLGQFIFAFLLVVSPWFLRNDQKHDKLTLSTVSSTTIRSFHLALTLVEAEGIDWEAAKLRVFEMDEDGSALWTIVRSYPTDFVKVQLRGIARTFLGTEVGTWVELTSAEPYQGSGILNALLSGNVEAIRDAIVNISSSKSPGTIFLLGWGILYTLFILGLSSIGIYQLLRYGVVDLRYFAVMLLVIILYLIITPGAAGEARFRVPVEPGLAYLSALAFMNKLKVTRM
jgi:4-amino-4-deoxy-L-arabinose transferase-like glycosyltransferase